MTPAQQAALEQAAREWLIARGIERPSSSGFVEPSTHVQSLVTLLAAQRAAVLEEAGEQTITAAMRDADRVFEKVGGSTRHYVRDCLLPIMKRHGLIVVRDHAQEPRP